MKASSSIRQKWFTFFTSFKNSYFSKHLLWSILNSLTNKLLKEDKVSKSYSMPQANNVESTCLDTKKMSFPTKVGFMSKLHPKISLSLSELMKISSIGNVDIQIGRSIYDTCCR